MNVYTGATGPEAAKREAYAVHATTLRAWNGISRSGLIPGGPRQARNITHFLRETDLKGCGLRIQTKIMILVDPGVLESHESYIAENGYILTKQII